jgi:hypothetical protein
MRTRIADLDAVTPQHERASIPGPHALSMINRGGVEAHARRQGLRLSAKAGVANASAAAASDRMRRCLVNVMDASSV